MASSWIDLLALYLQYDSTKKAREDAKNPTFVNRPLTPEERKIQQMWLDEAGYKQGERGNYYDILSQIGQGLLGPEGSVPNYKPEFRSMYYNGGQGQKPLSTMKLPAIDFSRFTGENAFWNKPPGANITGQQSRLKGPPTPEGGLNFLMEMDSPSPFDNPGEPQWGETIGDWLTRNPGGNPGDYLPGGGGGSGATNPWDRGMEYGSLPPALVNWASQQLKNHGWDLAATIAGVAAGPMGSMAVEAIKTVYNHLKGKDGGGGSGTQAGLETGGV